MIFTKSQILEKAGLVRDICNIVLFPKKVEKILLIGSYASGKQTDWSDIDLLIQLPRTEFRIEYPSWEQIAEIHQKLGTNRVHVIFGTVECAESLHQKHKGKEKDYSYKELSLQGGY
jgi:predicted nucleotidyltransferase